MNEQQELREHKSGAFFLLLPCAYEKLLKILCVNTESL